MNPIPAHLLSQLFVDLVTIDAAGGLGELENTFAAEKRLRRIGHRLVDLEPLAHPGVRRVAGVAQRMLGVPKSESIRLAAQAVTPSPRVALAAELIREHATAAIESENTEGIDNWLERERRRNG